MDELKSFIISNYRTLCQLNFNIYSFMNQMELLFEKLNFRSDEIENDNILIVRTDVIGDYILTTPFIREVRNNNPNANIVLVTSPLSYNLACTNKYVDEVYVVNGSTQYVQIGPLLIDLLEFCHNYLWFDKNGNMRRFKYAFTPQWGSDNFIPCILSYLSNARYRIGYGFTPHISWMLNFKDNPNLGVTLTDWVDTFILNRALIVKQDVVHEVDKHLYPLKYLGWHINNTDLELDLTNDDINKAKMLISPLTKKKVVVGISAGKPCAIYDINKFNDVLKQIDDADFIVVGGINDKKLASNLTVPILDLTGQLSLRETAAVISLSDLYLGNDTGMLHMAATFKKPVVLISREAKDKMNDAPGVMSSIARFHPWHTKYEIVQPKHAIDECAYTPMHGGCCRLTAHCINQIKPEEIVEAYKKVCE